MNKIGKFYWGMIFTGFIVATVGACLNDSQIIMFGLGFAVASVPWLHFVGLKKEKIMKLIED